VSESAISEAFEIITSFGDFMVTKQGNMIGAIELQGFDPDILLPSDMAEIAVMTRLIMAQLPLGSSLTQYYIHADAGKINLKKRDNPLNELLSSEREKALNGRGVSVSKLVHLVTIPGPTSKFSHTITDIIKSGSMGIIDKNSRTHFKRLLTSYGNLLLQEDELKARADRLKLGLQKYGDLWSSVMDSKLMSLSETWAFCKYLGTFDERYLLDDVSNLPVPLDDLDIAVANGDIDPVTVHREEALKLHGAEPRYMQAAAITSSPRNPTGIWAKAPAPPIKLRGHYIYQTHFTPMSEFDRANKFRVARTRLDRTSLSMTELFGMTDNVSGPKEERLHLKEKRIELEKAESISDTWGVQYSQIAVIASDPTTLKKTKQRLDSNLAGRGLGLTWESAALPLAFKTLQPGGYVHSFRQATVTTTRAAAFSLLCAPNIGQKDTEAPIASLEGEEAQYIFETEGGEPFYFSPYTGGRAFIISVGPTRSGKTFLKNTLATHFTKYGGLHRAIDIDAGTETLAKLFEDDGGLFRVDADNNRGLNPLASMGDNFDTGFAAHMNQLLLLLLQANDSDVLRVLEEDEEAAIDKAVRAMIKMPTDLRDLPNFVSHLPKDAQRKFSRWFKDGPYDGLFNADKDSMGGLGKRIGVFNLQAYRDDTKALRPLLLEIFYRITKEFESEEYKHVPKLLEIDEAHHALSLPTFRDFLVKKIRTWGKYGAGVSLWTQSPEDYLRTEGWDAIRSAATTFIFTADPRANEEAYANAFGLGKGEINVIKTLRPRREALIIQPENNVAKKVILDAEPLQVVVNTSTPNEIIIREQMIKEHGFQLGLQKAAIAISENAKAIEESVA